jgi:hypothetical protein
VNADLRAVLLKEHEEAEGLGVGDVEVVAREDADPGGAVGEGGVEVGEEEAEAGGFDEGDGEIDFVGFGDGGAEVGEEGAGAAGDEPVDDLGRLGGEGVEPAAGLAGAMVGGGPTVERGVRRERCEPLGEAGFVGVGEVAAIDFGFAGAVLEADEERAAGLEGGPEEAEGGWDFGGGQMEEAGAGPDAVVAGDLVDVGEGADGDGLAEVLGGEGGEFGAGVEGVDAVAVEEKGFRVPAGAAAGVEDEAAGGGGRRGSGRGGGRDRGGGWRRSRRGRGAGSSRECRACDGRWRLSMADNLLFTVSSPVSWLDRHSGFSVILYLFQSQVTLG